MATDVERLIVRLEANQRAFEKQLAAAAHTADKRARAIETRFAKANQHVAAIGARAFQPMMMAATAVLGPILSVAGAIAGAKQALTEFDRIGKQAKAAGLDSEFWQELEHAARLGGVGVDQLSQALNAFTRNTGMAAIGKGELVEKLKQLHPELLRNILAAGSMQERIRLVADALAKETDASRKAAIAAAAFGDAGVKMVEMLKNGSAGLDETARQARNLGLVIDRDLIARSEEMNDQLSTASRAVDLNLKQALLNIAPVLIYSARLIAAMTGDVRRFIDALKDLEDRSSSGLDERMRAIGADRLRIENEILALQEKQRQATGMLAEVEKRLLEGTISKKREELAAIAAEEERILGILDSRKPVEPTIAPAQVDWENIDIDGSAASRNRAAEAAIKEAEAVRELIEQLTIERNELTLSDEQRRINEALRRAGAAATAEQRDQIQALISEIEAEKAAIEENKQAHDARVQAVEFGMQSVFSALEGIADGSMTAEEALKAMLVQLLKAIAMAALLGQGPLGGLFGGGLLGNLMPNEKGNAFHHGRVTPFARGGVVNKPTVFPMAKGIGLMGEAGPEAIMPLRRGPGGRLGVEASGSGMDGGRSSVVITLDEGLRAEILDQAKGQSIQIVQANNKARNRLWSVGGNPR